MIVRQQEKTFKATSRRLSNRKCLSVNRIKHLRALDMGSTDKTLNIMYLSVQQEKHLRVLDTDHQTGSVCPPTGKTLDMGSTDKTTGYPTGKNT